MAKYHELMEHIEVTEEMSGRILKNVDVYFRGKARAKRRIILSAAGALAAAAVFGIVIFNHSMRVEEPETSDLVQGIYGAQEYSSAEELSKAAGFSVTDVEHLPFDAEQTVYCLLDGILSEIDYNGKNDTLTFRKSAGEVDISGDYTVYEEEKKVQVQGKTVTLKGEKGKYFLAVWKDAGYSYSLRHTQGLEEEMFLQMIS